MKSPEYVSLVTRIYRKYINLAYSDEPYIVNENDRKLLALAFNRGGFSTGHLTHHNNLIYKEKPNNIGLFLGTVKKYDSKKGLITLTLKETLSIGDSICLEKEDNLYNVSELMLNKQNKKECFINDSVTIGRMKGKINIGNKIYKMVDKKLNLELKQTFYENSEIRKIPLNANIYIHFNKPISLNITTALDIPIYNNLNITVESNTFPEKAKNSALTKENVLTQITKIQNTPYEFLNIDFDLEDNLFIPNSVLNELKRNAIEKVEEYVLTNIVRKKAPKDFENINQIPYNNESTKSKISISILLNNLDLEQDYSKLENVNNIYLPLKYFLDKKYEAIIHILESDHNLFIYLPTIMRNNYNKLFNNNIEHILNLFKIEGFVISNISGFNLLNKIKDLNKYILIGNYTLNVYNYYTAKALKDFGLTTITVSPELDYEGIQSLSNSLKNSELIVYGNIPVMNSNYCLFSGSNKCKFECVKNSNNYTCKQNTKYYLKDRMNFKFRVITDNIDTITTIYNSKITSINYKDFNISSVRIDILDENVDEINNIINTVRNGNKLEGNQYTSGNLYRNI